MLFLDANTLGQTHLAMGERVLTALLGYAVVFAGLLVLMAIVFGMGAVFKAIRRKKSASAARPAAPAAKAARPAAEPAKPEGKPAPGTAGEVKRFDVPDKEAAMIMAIVADQMGKPLNELRFKSIKEVK
ncbi:MAG: OadG family protein [Oscillospiraceae bacterium]|nr:OadG family protein [Oscillospiraceae bacterium]